MDEVDEIPPEQEVQEVLYEIADIKAQIASAKANAIQGNYSDPVWFAKVNSALRYKQARHQELLRMLAAKRRKENEQKKQSDEVRFVQAARQMLDRDTYMSIWAVVNGHVEAE